MNHYITYLFTLRIHQKFDRFTKQNKKQKQKILLQKLFPVF